MPKTDSTQNTVGCKPIKPDLQTNQIPWKKLEKKVFKLQTQIYQAASRGSLRTVRKLQKTLLHSKSAKMIAVRRVTQDYIGKQFITLVERLKLSSKRVSKLKARDKKSPLLISIIYDRALQTLVKLALEPEWEAYFEPNSYGFRPQPGCHDAIEAIVNQLRTKPKYILKADIVTSFDKINPEKLLQKLNTFPTLKRQIRAWLKAGVLEQGVISPLLRNIALHGLENQIKEFASEKNRGQEIPLIRYADHFLIIHESLAVVEKCKEIMESGLNELGLTLNPEKTRITHTFKTHQGKKGFQFLGVDIRHQKNLTGFTLKIRPSKDKVLAHYQKLRDIINSHKSASQSVLIKKLNPIIKEWVNYYSTVTSTQENKKLDHLLSLKLLRWAKRRHNNQGIKKVVEKYWHPKKLGRWKFAVLKENKILIQLLKHSKIHHKKPIKINEQEDRNLNYWRCKMGANPLMPTRVIKLLKKQAGKCTHRGMFYKDGDTFLSSTYVKRQLIEEPDEAKVSRPVLKTSHFGDRMA